MSQNRSHAVMAQRAEPHDSLDFFPTPPWATRALMEHALGVLHHLDMYARLVVWEPACGAGHMARPLAEYFRDVVASDVHDYGFGAVHDFLMPFLPAVVDRFAAGRPDWVITNPPFRQAAEFALRGKAVASQGVALLVRTAFLEGAERWRELFQPHPPVIVAPFVERVPMLKGRLDPGASSATSYTWIVWLTRPNPYPTATAPHLIWIPPCRKRLERAGDYEPPAAGEAGVA